MIPRRLTGCLLVVGLLSECGPATVRQLAIANANHLLVVDADSGQTLQDITRYSEVMRLAYRPDGERLAVGVCFGNRVVELETSGYAEQGAPITAAGCPWDVTYAPDGQSLAATTPFRPSPLDALFGHLRIVGPQANHLHGATHGGGPRGARRPAPGVRQPHASLTPTRER